MNRRTFLKIAGMGSISFAFGCNPPQKNLFSLVQAPDDIVTGKATWYASTCRECPAGCGILAKNREGRIVKIEGNPLHPINRGRLCMRGQAALQAVYDPDRLKAPLLKKGDRWQPISFAKAEALLKSRAEEAAAKGANRVAMVSEVIGPSMMRLLTAALQNWGSPPPLIFEPYAYEALKLANREVFGIDGLVSYRMEEADVLLSFGAEFLETWLSPVEYAWKFKTMHALNQGHKGKFFHVGPYKSLTGANADYWLACKPGSEATIAMGLVRQALDIRKGGELPASFLQEIYDATNAYTQEKVLEESGLPLELYEKLIISLMETRKPLVLGSGTAVSDLNGIQTNLAANLLNLLLDPGLDLIDFDRRHRVETASRHAEVMALFDALKSEEKDLLILNNVNPVFAIPPSAGVSEALAESKTFVVSLSNFMDETSMAADLILPVRLPMETWDDYSGWQNIISTIQPVMGKLTPAPHLGDVILKAGFEKDKPADTFKAYLIGQLNSEQNISSQKQWVDLLQKGGRFEPETLPPRAAKIGATSSAEILKKPAQPIESEPVLIAAPSIRYFDGRGANRPWLSEIPDATSRIAWQTPVLMHPRTAQSVGIKQGDIIRITTDQGSLEAPVYDTELVKTGVMVMGRGQGHTGYGRFAENAGINPLSVFQTEIETVCGGPGYRANIISVKPTGLSLKLARMQGSRIQHKRTFALSITKDQLQKGSSAKKYGLTMEDFPLTLPLPEGYDSGRDFYPPHEHDTYRWGMVVDLDRCIGCGACSAACYAENNIGITGVERIIEGREMTWIDIVCYHDERRMDRVTFLPMMCQHCDNAPCESVCPVYAPHHSKEGLNNQIYNRCIGTRFCVQNCPWKVRRFNWFTWRWPSPLNLQLNPDVTVRSKGVMEKCSFCIQRIKVARNVAKNEKRDIRDGEVTPACVQTCPTDALVFGNLMDKTSRARKMVEDPRAYQMLGYLNTKPAVIYLKKVIHEV